MGCASSKGVKVVVAADVYRPPPASIALFDISTIDEPWLITTTTEDQLQDKKPTHMPLQILDKLDTYELAPHSWSEVSKALEDLKPSLHQNPTNQDIKKSQPPSITTAAAAAQPLQKTHSIHTLAELEAQLSSPNKKKPDSPPALPPRVRSPPRLIELNGLKPVRENSFILRDRQERENNKTSEHAVRWRRRDPLEGYPEKPPPGNTEGVVIYTTTLRGVRRTFEDCERARRAVEGHALDIGVEVDERDVSLHGEYLKEVRGLVGEGESVPRLFVRGRYVGGVEEVVELSETGRLGDMLKTVSARGGGRRGCEGCGGMRFVPCLECKGSCKVLGEDGKGVVRCGECNENGLVLCPLCH